MPISQTKAVVSFFLPLFPPSVSRLIENEFGRRDRERERERERGGGRVSGGGGEFELTANLVYYGNCRGSVRLRRSPSARLLARSLAVFIIIIVRPALQFESLKKVPTICDRFRGRERRE